MTDEPDALHDGDRFFQAVEHAIARPRRGPPVKSPQVDEASAHVLVLLQDACATFLRGSFGTSVFLAITALEETAKIEMMMYRRESEGTDRPKGRDPLRDHAQKHIIAVRPTVFMGARLLDVLGRERCEALKSAAEAGQLTALRESAIYTDFDRDPMVTPRTAISRARAFEVLLLALEAADDILVGYTTQSFALGDQINALAKSISEGQ